MKLPFKCYLCENIDGDILKKYFLEVDDLNIYNLICDRGHHTLILPQITKFELLFDMGTQALIDGYTREAIVNVASSLERFYEFCIELFCEINKVSCDSYQTTWKLISKQTERQLGAYFLLYLNCLKRLPVHIPDKQVNFRNRVIHQGYIPNNQEVMEYICCVYEVIKASILELRSNFLEDIYLVVYRQVDRLKCKISAENILGVADANVINLLSPDMMEETYPKALEKIRKNGFSIANG